LKRELWVKVKPGDPVIFVHEGEGVFKAKVLETDLRIYEPGEPSRFGYPYGLTKDTGVVKILYDETERIENLADLVAYTAAKFARLRSAWSKWSAQDLAARQLLEEFLALTQELKEAST